MFPFKDIHDDFIKVTDKMREPLAYLVEEVGDIMYYHQCIQQPDASEFDPKIVKEINGHENNKNWKSVDRSTIPEEVKVIPSVWSMRKKQDLVTNQVTKYKACLKLHGGIQELGVNYYETYAPVITWMAI